MSFTVPSTLGNPTSSPRAIGQSSSSGLKLCGFARVCSVCVCVAVFGNPDEFRNDFDRSVKLNSIDGQMPPGRTPQALKIC